MVYVAEKLSDYVERLSFEDIPPESIKNAKYRILDTIAVGLAGFSTDWARQVFEYAIDRGGKPESTVMMFGGKTNAENAALVNGTMAHSLDYDDDLAGCHVGCVVIPAALAMAEKLGGSGKEVIISVIAGYDVTVAVSRMLNSRILYQRGFHPTSVCGVFGSCATAGRLLELDTEKIAIGLGIAGSFVSGSMEYLADGSWTKRLQPGKAAKDGITAVLLAERGYVGPKSIFEGNNGILKAYTGEAFSQTFLDGLGRDFEVNKAITKRYPVCSCNTAPIEATLKIISNHQLKPEDIKAVEVKTTEVCIGLVGEPIEEKRNPQTVLEAQMSLPYCLAVTSIDGEFTLKQIQEERLHDLQVLDLTRRIHVVSDASFDISVHPRPQPGIVTLETTRGDIYTERIDFPKGDSRNPLSEGELLEKLETCVGDLMGAARIRRIAESVLELEKVRDTSYLMKLLRPDKRT
jgi:2-methylcitrate dehydratase PrpD